MNNLTSLIIDDEINSRDTLKKFLTAYCPEVEVVAEGSSVKEGLDIIKTHDPQLVFLDIHLTDGEGFDILRQLGEIRFEIIFTTGFDNFAIKAIKYAALDYLLKPLIPEELQEAVKRALQKRNEALQTITPAIQPSTVTAPVSRIAVPDNNGLKVIQLNKIIYCTAKGNYTSFTMADQAELLVCKTLKEYDVTLPQPPFLRIHNSHIINLDHVKSYVKGRGGQAEMTNGVFVDIARNRKQPFLDALTSGRF